MKRQARQKQTQRKEVAKPIVSSKPIVPEPPLQTAEDIFQTTEKVPSKYQGNWSLDLDVTTSSGSLPWHAEPRTREEDWYRRKGYLPPVDDQTLETIRVVLGAKAARKMAAVKSEDRLFPEMLNADRNVQLDPDPTGDPYVVNMDEILFSLPENPAVADLFSRLWIADIDNCKEENEAVFQRTVMMAFLDRHRLIYGDVQKPEKGSGKPTEIGKKLAFSVEGDWRCDPMPTRGADAKDAKFLTAPKPDLCVSFQRSKLLGPGFWPTMTPAMKKLACYEGVQMPQNKRAFGFFVVEAKKSRDSADNSVAKYQALNAASQALHNLHEFFREAGQETVFFESVRFFSATASEKGVILRIHRAEKLELEPQGLDAPRPIDTNPPYNLEFRFQEYGSFLNENFKRERVVDMFGKIMVGYGEGVLFGLLRKAAEKIDEKLRVNRKRGIDIGSVTNDYSYGQGKLRPSRSNSKVSRQSKASTSANTSQVAGRSAGRVRSTGTDGTSTNHTSNSGTEAAGDNISSTAPDHIANMPRTNISGDFSGMMSSERPQKRPKKATAKASASRG